MLQFAESPVSIADLCTKLGAYQSEFAKQSQQGNVADISCQLRVVRSMQQHHVLDDEFDVYHAAGVMFEIEFRTSVGMRFVQLLAHGEHFLLEFFGLTFLTQYGFAYGFETLADAGITGAVACAGERLMFPQPG